MHKDTFSTQFSEDTLFNEPSPNTFEGSMLFKQNTGGFERLSTGLSLLGENSGYLNNSQNNIFTRKIGGNNHQQSIGFQPKKGTISKKEKQSDIFFGSIKNKESCSQLFEDHVLDSFKQSTGCSLNFQAGMSQSANVQSHKTGITQKNQNELRNNNKESSNQFGFCSSNPFKNNDLMAPVSSLNSMNQHILSNFPPQTPPMKRNVPQISITQSNQPIKPKIIYSHNNSNLNPVDFSNMFKHNDTNKANDFDFSDNLFAKESLSAMWSIRPDELQSLDQQNISKKSTIEQTFSIEQALKQHLNSDKKLLGKSSFQQSHHIPQTSFLSTHTMMNQNNSMDDEKDLEKSSRGLRNLSLKVKQIVVQKGTTSYKVVADMLVEELRGEVSDLNSEEMTKDEQNIKRRVYDALNVLIAANVIEKKGKSVQSCPKSMLDGRCLRAENWKNVKSIEAQVQQKKQQLQEKKNKVSEYATKLLALKNLIERNKRVEQEESLHQIQQNVESSNKCEKNNSKANNQDNAKDQRLIDSLDSPSSILNFPLLFVHSGLSLFPESKIVMKMSSDQQSMKLFCKEQMTVLGDLDILVKLKMDQVDMTFAKKHLKQEFFQEFYLPNVSTLRLSANNNVTKQNLIEIEQDIVDE